jgi:hypothetical protein
VAGEKPNTDPVSETAKALRDAEWSLSFCISHGGAEGAREPLMRAITLYSDALIAHHNAVEKKKAEGAKP